MRTVVEVELAVEENEPIPHHRPIGPAELQTLAGITVNLNVMPASMYWEQWTDVEFGITGWGHRPLATMVLALAYRTDGEWNETHWSNKEFDRLLSEAEGIYEVEARRRLMCQIENIMQEDGPVAIPHWEPITFMHRTRVKGYEAAPESALKLEEVYLDNA